MPAPTTRPVPVVSDARPRPKPRQRDEDDEDDRPRQRKRPREQEEDDDQPASQSQYAEFDDEGKDRKPTGKRKRDVDRTLTPEERQARAAAFDRGMWGARLIHMGIVCYCVAMLAMIAALFHTAVVKGDPSAYVVIAGLLGLANWLLGIVGVGLCIASYPSPGHRRFTILAAVCTGVHLMMLVVLLSQATHVDSSFSGAGYDQDMMRWEILTTRLNSLIFYIAAGIYQDELLGLKQVAVLSLIVGAFEMIRMVTIMVALSCLAQSAGDTDLCRRCVRCAGVVSIGPGLMAVFILVFAAFVIEANITVNKFTVYFFMAVIMGIYAILAGMHMPAMLATRETATACEFPFSAEKIVIGG